MTHMMYQAVMKRRHTFFIGVSHNKFNNPSNDNYYYVMQYYDVLAAIAMALVDTCD